MKAPLQASVSQRARDERIRHPGVVADSPGIVGIAGEDRRPSVALQRQLDHMADNSVQTQRHNNLSGMLENSRRTVAQTQMINSAGPLQRVSAPAPAKANRTGLPDQLKSGVESLSGMSLDHVKVHYNSSHPAQLNAHAYAQGSEIHMAPGQERHLPHETWHVVQQAQGRVPTTMQLAGVNVNDNAGLEAEADMMGARALQQSSHLAASPALAQTGGEPATQRKETASAHAAGCCCGQCGGAPLQRVAVSTAGAVVQRTLSIDIEDTARNISKTGTSGNEAIARSGFSKYPKLQSAFESVATPEHIVATEKHDAYDRNGYMCAEPHALGLLLHHYDLHDAQLVPGDLAALRFPALAVNNDDQKSIPPCPVCAKWLNSVAPLTLQNLHPADMRSKRQIDKAKDEEHEERLRLEAEELARQEKDAKKSALARERSINEVRADAVNKIVSEQSALVLRLHDDIFGKIKKNAPSTGDRIEKVRLLLVAWIEVYDKGNPNVTRIVPTAFAGDIENEFAEWAKEHKD